MGQLVTSCQGENPPFVFRCDKGYLADLSSNNFPIDCKRDCTKSAKFAIPGNETHYIECVFNGRGWQEETKPCLRNYYFNKETKQCDPKSNTPVPPTRVCENECDEKCSLPSFIPECETGCTSVCETDCPGTCEVACPDEAVTECQLKCDSQCKTNCTVDKTITEIIKVMCFDVAEECCATNSADCETTCKTTKENCQTKFLGICESQCKETCHPGCETAACRTNCETKCTDACPDDPKVNTCQTDTCNLESCKQTCKGKCPTP